MFGLLKFVGLIIILIGLVNNQGYAQAENLILADWQLRMDAAQKRVDDAESRKSANEADIESIEAQILELEGQIAAVEKEIEGLFGLSDEDLATAKSDFAEKVADLNRKLDGLLALPPEELFERQDELEALRKELEALGLEEISALEESQSEMDKLARKIKQIEGKIPKAPPKPPSYTVVRGDYLWKISGRSEIYNDPYKWMRIYTANRDQIKEPDLIFPKQQFDIPQQAARNEYWVEKGDWLEKIAGNSRVYNNPFKWTKIYEANRGVIGDDPSVIYPHQILIVPQ